MQKKTFLIEWEWEAKIESEKGKKSEKIEGKMCGNRILSYYVRHGYKYILSKCIHTILFFFAEDEGKGQWQHIKITKTMAMTMLLANILQRDCVDVCLFVCLLSKVKRTKFTYNDEYLMSLYFSLSNSLPTCTIAHTTQYVYDTHYYYKYTHTHMFGANNLFIFLVTKRNDSLLSY